MYKYYETGLKNENMRLKDKFFNLSLGYVFCVFILAFVGTMVLYSAANGSWSPWAIKHLMRFGISCGLMFFLAMIDIKIYIKYSYIAYFLVVLLLVAVEITGHIGMGAQRWIDLKLFKLQPSELMKITLVLALAKYFHASTLNQIQSTRSLIAPAFMAFFPAALIILQPDLGTALMLLFMTGFMFFVVGVQWWKFGAIGGVACIFAPVAWHFLHDYQKNRVLTFLDPERDPLGAGYHIIQSKIALGSGGVFGKGFLNGTQSHLNFLPEKHTDFIFTMFSEEFGMIGGVLLILLNIIILGYGFVFAFRTTSYFAKLVIIGLNTNYFLYVFINIAMVLGLLPVVGIPLPLISYGGTVMLSVMASFGIILCMDINRDINLGRTSLGDD